MKSRLAVAASRQRSARRHAEGAEWPLRAAQRSRLAVSVRKFVHALTGTPWSDRWPVGAAGANAAMESFFSLLQKNVLNRQTWATPRGAPDRDRDLDRKDVSPTPSTGGPGRLTPVEYELIMTTTPPRRPNPNCHPFVQQTRCKPRQ